MTSTLSIGRARDAPFGTTRSMTGNRHPVKLVQRCRRDPG
jgi:hypothetical protein